MREILFRGKRVDNGEWEYGGCVLTENKVCLIYNQTHSIDLQGFTVEENSVGQYTGLTDKNGKKIFEGDILMSCGETLLVLFSDTRAGFVAVDKNNVVYPFLKQAVVIGNIHDNLELLEVTE